MQLEELKGKIKTNQIDNHYIFVGENHGLMKIYINEISARKNYPIKYVDNLAEVEQNKNKGTLIKQHFIFVVIDDDEFLQSEAQKRRVKLGQSQGDNIVIFMYNENKKLKDEDNNVVKFENLNLPIARRYVKRRITMNDSYVDLFVKLCEFNVDRINNELSKIINLSKMSRISEEKAFEECYNNGLFYIPEKLEVFNLVEDMLRKNWKAVKHQVQLFKDVDENPLGFIVLLYNAMKGIYLMKIADKTGNKATAENTGLQKYQIATALNYKNNFSTAEAYRICRCCRWIDKAIKIGDLDTHFAMDFLLSQFDK